MENKLENLTTKFKVIKEFDRGWDSLLLNFLEVFDEVYKEGVDLGVELYIIQTKEKFAGLRIYWGYEIKDGREEDEDVVFFLNKASDILTKKEIEIDKLSYETCEYCGATVNVYVNKDRLWQKSLCRSCHDLRMRKHKCE